MAVWGVRAGKLGEREGLAIDKCVAVVGWEDMPDMSALTTRAQVEDVFRKAHPNRGDKIVSNRVGQLWAFRGRIKVGDVIGLPMKTQSFIALGEVKGDYKYRPDLPSDARHTRPVEWVRKDIARTSFDSDLRFSFGSSLTVFKVERNHAEQRVRALISGKAVPPSTGTSASVATSVDGVADVTAIDVEQYASDQIVAHIQQKFKGHEMANLVAAVLAIQGYQTQPSTPGADGGVDILAGRGPMGFDPPRLCVQVKSEAGPVDVKILHELQGVLKNFGAEQGLLVAWGGFKETTRKEARQHYFEIRLWDSGDLLKAVLANYDALPADVQAALPLKRIWTLVPTDAEG